MREDQLIALADIQADVCDLFLEECQVKNWPSLDTKEGRGDAYWYKQNAKASLGLVAQIENVLAARAARLAAGHGSRLGADEESADKLLKRIANKADALLERAGLDGKRKG